MKKGDGRRQARGGASGGRRQGHRLRRDPVMGHLGLPPERAPAGGWRAGQVVRRGPPDRGRHDPGGRRLLCGGARGGPRGSRGPVARRLSIPTIGIGAGAACDGQALVVHDLPGSSTASRFRESTPTFAPMQRAFEEYIGEVRERRFPAPSIPHHGRPGIPRPGARDRNAGIGIGGGRQTAQPLSLMRPGSGPGCESPFSAPARSGACSGAAGPVAQVTLVGTWAGARGRRRPGIYRGGAEARPSGWVRRSWGHGSGGRSRARAGEVVADSGDRPPPRPRTRGGSGAYAQNGLGNLERLGPGSRAGHHGGPRSWSGT